MFKSPQELRLMCVYLPLCLAWLVLTLLGLMRRGVGLWLEMSVFVSILNITLLG